MIAADYAFDAEEPRRAAKALSSASDTRALCRKFGLLTAASAAALVVLWFMDPGKLC